MTRAVVFLLAALVAASLGVVAQDAAGSRQNSSVQQTTANTAAQPSSPGASASVTSSPARDSGQSPTTDSRGSGVKDSAQDEENAAKDNNAQLPQTSTILPLLGLIGLGSLVAGFFARR